MASYGLGQTILVGSHTTQRISALMEVGGFAAHDADDLLITLRYRASRWQGCLSAGNPGAGDDAG